MLSIRLDAVLALGRSSGKKKPTSTHHELPQASGGRILFPKAFEDIVPLFSQIAEELGSAYSLGYVSNLPASARGFREIKITTRQSGFQVSQSRRGYVID